MLNRNKNNNTKRNNRKAEKETATAEHTQIMC